MDGEPVVIALVGARGMLAKALLKAMPPKFQVHCLTRPEFDLADAELIFRVLKQLRPQIIINCAAYTNVDGCETDVEAAFSVNGEGPGNLARAALETGGTLVHISSDYVFSGEGDSAYKEDDEVGPCSVYGRSKLAGEKAIIDSGLKNFFIVRTSWLYGLGGKNFVETMVRLGKEREELRVVADQVGCPTFADDLAMAVFNLLELENNEKQIPYGIYHFSNEGSCSWSEFAEAILSEAKCSGEQIVAKLVVPIGTDDYPLPAKRPAYSVLSKDKYRQATGADVPHWRDSLARYFQKERN